MLNPLLKQIEKIEVVAGQYENGMWYAVTAGMPWLAAEGDSYSEVVRTMDQIAPVLVGNASCMKIDFELVWRMARNWE